MVKVQTLHGVMISNKPLRCQVEKVITSQSMPDDPRKIQLKKVAETSMVFPPNKAFAMSNCPKCQKKVKSTEDYQLDYMGLIPERC